MLVGYARISTQEQTLALQHDASQQAGCALIYTAPISGATWTAAERAWLTEALAFMRPGDTLGAWKLDRLGRSLKHLIETMTLLQECGTGFKSLTEQIDPTSSGGKLVFHVCGALAEFDHDLIRERTQVGRQAVRVRGRRGAVLGGWTRRNGSCSTPCMPTKVTLWPISCARSRSRSPRSIATSKPISPARGCYELSGLNLVDLAYGTPSLPNGCHR